MRPSPQSTVFSYLNDFARFARFGAALRARLGCHPTASKSKNVVLSYRLFCEPFASGSLASVFTSSSIVSKNFSGLNPTASPRCRGNAATMFGSVGKSTVIAQEHDFTRHDDAAIAISLGKGRATTGQAAGKLQLTFSSGLCAGRPIVQLSQPVVTFGRDQNCDVILDGETVSRRHCEIICRGASYILRDASRNGTFLNGERVEQASLKDGDQIRIGQNIVLVTFSSGSATNGVTTGKLTTSQPAARAAAWVELDPHIVVKGLEPGVTQSFSETQVTIGRRDGNQVVLEADNISRHHAAIIRREAGYLLRDLGSANGTFLNEQRVETAPLHDGDRLRIGNFTATINLLDQDCILIFKRATKE